MKTIHFLLLMLILTTACKKQKATETTNISVQTPVKDSIKGIIDTIPTVKATVGKQIVGDFAFNLLRQENLLNRQENYCISPISLKFALAMLATGAKAETAQEIEQVLGESIATNKERYPKQLQLLNRNSENIVFSIANSLWISDKLKVKRDWQKDVEKTFDAKTTIANFKAKETIQKMNQWANKQTKGKIPHIIDNLGDQEVLILLNAIYFHGDWENPFSERSTQTEDFQGIKGKQKVSMMHKTGHLAYASKTKYDAIALPYKDPDYALTIILPHKGITLDKIIENELNTKEWTKLQENMSSQLVDLALPAFHLENTLSMNELLQLMSIHQAFSATKANFSNIADLDTEPLFVSSVQQKTFFEVNEKGAEAAATIKVDVTGKKDGDVKPIVPIPFICNRPFFFILHEKSTDNILFAGKFVKN